MDIDNGTTEKTLDTDVKVNEQGVGLNPRDGWGLVVFVNKMTYSKVFRPKKSKRIKTTLVKRKEP